MLRLPLILVCMLMFSCQKSQAQPIGSEQAMRNQPEDRCLDYKMTELYEYDSEDCFVKVLYPEFTGDGARSAKLNQLIIASLRRDMFWVDGDEFDLGDGAREFIQASKRQIKEEQEIMGFSSGSWVDTHVKITLNGKYTCLSHWGGVHGGGAHPMYVNEYFTLNHAGDRVEPVHMIKPAMLDRLEDLVAQRSSELYDDDWLHLYSHWRDPESNDGGIYVTEQGMAFFSISCEADRLEPMTVVIPKHEMNPYLKDQYQDLWDGVKGQE